MELKDLVNFIIDIVKKKNLNKIYDINNPAKNGFKILKNVLNHSCTFEKLSNILYTTTTINAINSHDILFFQLCFISSIISS